MGLCGVWSSLSPCLSANVFSSWARWVYSSFRQWKITVINSPTMFSLFFAAHTVYCSCCNYPSASLLPPSAPSFLTPAIPPFFHSRFFPVFLYMHIFACSSTNALMLVMYYEWQCWWYFSFTHIQRTKWEDAAVHDYLWLIVLPTHSKQSAVYVAGLFCPEDALIKSHWIKCSNTSILDILLFKPLCKKKLNRNKCR